MSDANALGHELAASARRAPVPAELEHDRREHERRERVRDQAGHRGAGAEREEHDTGRRWRRRRGRKVVASARSDARRQAISGPIPISRSSGSPKIAQEEVVVRAADTTASPRTASESDRPGDPPEDRQAERHEQEVVVEERRLARHERLEPVGERSSGSRQKIERDREGDGDAR